MAAIALEATHFLASSSSMSRAKRDTGWAINLPLTLTAAARKEVWRVSSSNLPKRCSAPCQAFWRGEEAGAGEYNWSKSHTCGTSALGVLGVLLQNSRGDESLAR